MPNLDKIIQLIKNFKTIIIQRHINPDPDAIGSQHGLAEIIKHSFPSKHVYCIGEDSPSLLWLGKSDKITDSTFDKALVIVTDCPDVDRISDARWHRAKEVIKIDHHPLVDTFADYAWIDSNKTSACEMIYDLANSSKNLHLDKRSASLLYAGIIGDTGRFMFSGVTSHTFMVVAQLAKFGINMNRINQLESEVDINTCKLYGYLDLHLQILQNGTAYYIIPLNLLQKFHIKPGTFISRNIPSNIKGIIAWVSFFEQPDKTWKVGFRSHAPAISGLAEKYNGGGHALASGARISNKKTISKIVEDLNGVVNKYIENKHNK